MTGAYIIMGANGGIGENLAKRCIAAGHDVYLTARDTASLSADMKNKAKGMFDIDVLRPENIESAINEIGEEQGISGLAYCIGSIGLKPLKSSSDDDILAAFELNALGAVRTLRAAEKALKKAGGSVVLFSTIAVQQGFSHHSIISMAKGAIEGLTKTLAAEWAPHVRINCIAPSLTDTGIAKSLTSSGQMAESIAKMHPISRLGKPEDSASLAYYLLSKDAGWITGQIMHVDGGRSTLRVKG